MGAKAYTIVLQTRANTGKIGLRRKARGVPVTTRLPVAALCALHRYDR